MLKRRIAVIRYFLDDRFRAQPKSGGPKTIIAETVSASNSRRVALEGIYTAHCVASTRWHSVTLYLVQHGEACSKEVDPERPLTTRGKDDVDRLANFLERAGMRAERVMHSGKLRAEQTAESLAQAIAPGVEIETSGLINPNDNPKAFDWQSGSWDMDTLIVGHLPFLARLASHLVVGDENLLLTAFQPGSAVCLERDEDSHWRIAWMIRPQLLR